MGQFEPDYIQDSQIQPQNNCVDSGEQPNPSEDQKDWKWSVIAMFLFLFRGGLVWLLNVVLLAWILSLAVQKAVREDVLSMFVLSK